MPVPVPRWQRWVVGVAGAVLTGAGAYAVVLGGHDGLGSVALILSGVFLGLFAVIGRLPNKIWGKDMGIEFLTTEQAEEFVDELPRGSRQEIVNALVPAPTAGIRISAVAPSVQISAAAAESEMFELLCDLFIEHDVVPGLREQYQRGVSFTKRGVNNFRDAVVEVGEAEIVLQYRLRLTREAVRKSAEYVQLTQKTSSRPQGMIILVRTLDMDSLIEAAARHREAGGRLRVVELPGPDDDSARSRVLQAFHDIIEGMPYPRAEGPIA